MKPSIVNWVYLGLGDVFIYNVSAIGLDVKKLFERNSGFIEYPILQMIIIVVAIAALGGLVKKTPWVKIISFIAIGLEIFFMFGMSIVVSSETGLLIWPLVVGIPLLFLAYKIYTSEPLKIYLSNAKK